MRFALLFSWLELVIDRVISNGVIRKFIYLKSFLKFRSILNKQRRGISISTSIMVLKGEKMKMLSNVSALVVGIILAGSAAAQTVTVENSGFESPQANGLPIIGTLLGGVTPYTYNGITTNYLTGPTVNSGWYVSQGTVTVVNQGLLGLVVSPISNDSTGQYLALNGLGLSLLSGQLTPGTLGGISQSLSTTIGQTYQVNYLASALAVDAITSGTGILSAGVDGVTVTSPSGGALVTLNVGTFSNQSFTFTATGTTSILDFHETTPFGADVGGVAIDNVSVTAVPEPSHSAAILIGGVLLFTFWRRIRQGNQFVLPKAVKI